MKLKSTNKKIKSNEVEYIYTISVENLDEAKTIAYEKEYKNDFEAKGFRKGQAPRNIFEKVKGHNILQNEAINVLFEECFKDILKKNEYVVVGHPSVSMDEKLLAGGNIILSPFELKLLVPIKPDVELGKYKKVEIKGKNLKVSQKQVKDRIDEKLKKDTFLKPKESGKAVENGDTTIIDFEGFKDGTPFEGGKANNFSLKIGSGQFIPGFEEQIIGKNVNDEFDVNVVFPKEYFEKSLAGKPVVFKVKVLDIKVEEKPKFNDDYVKGLKIKGVSTKEEYQNHIEKEILKELEQAEKRRVQEAVVDIVAKEAKIDIHPAMIEYDVLRQKEAAKAQAKQYGIDFEKYLTYLGKTDEEYDKDLRKNSEQAIRINLALSKVIELENITASKEEVDKKYDEIAKAYGKTPAEIKKEYDKELIENEIKFQKVYDFLLKEAKIVKE